MACVISCSFSTSNTSIVLLNISIIVTFSFIHLCSFFLFFIFSVQNFSFGII